MKGRPIRIIVLLLAVLGIVAAAHASPSLLLRDPTLSRDSIVFVFAGELWRVPRTGGEATRLTTVPGRKWSPAFSPDGSQIAFTADGEGNADVYVMPADGGKPSRLTWHPADDQSAGWSPDGKQVLFSSYRATPIAGQRLYTVPVSGGPAAELPLPIAIAGSFSPDGSHLAYVPTPDTQAAWKHYRGGEALRIWLADLADSSVEKLPLTGANDFNPMWIGDTVYFLSDRDGPVTLYSFDVKHKTTRRLMRNDGFDIKSASAGPGAIVFAQLDAIRLFDLASGKVTTVDIRVTGDFPETHPRNKSVDSDDLIHGGLSPDGKQAVFETRGDIVSIPAGNGSPRNWTKTSGVAERYPAWSPDGKWVCYFSDESGEYELRLQSTASDGEIRKLKPSGPPSYYYYPVWSPDSTRVAYSDKHGNLWIMNIETGQATLVDTQPFMVNYGPGMLGNNAWSADPDPGAYSWSPDSRWLTYAQPLQNHLSGIFVYNVHSGVKHPVTDGMSDAEFPVFSDSGRYLYFAASTDSGPANDVGVKSILNPTATYSLYVAILDKISESPVVADDDTKARAAAPEHTSNAVSIDFDGLDRRIFALALDARNYQALAPGKGDTLFALEQPPAYLPAQTVDHPALPDCTLWKFNPASSKEKEEDFIDGVKTISVDAHRNRILFEKGDDWFVCGVDKSPKENEGKLNLNDFKIDIDPSAEWRQMFHEVWRIERDFFYDPGVRGLDLAKTEATYARFLDGLKTREDLNYLFADMLGELTVSHMYIYGGDIPEGKNSNVGLLGADYAIDHGRYRIARIYTRESWNPGLRAPLDKPGLNVARGDYILAVDGEDIPAAREIYSFFQDKAGKTVTLRIAGNPDGTDAREIKVKPVDNEQDLRNRAWIEDNRRAVARLSSNQLGYVYIPDTDQSGWEAFNRYYFPQIDRQGFIIDERCNGGGSFSDYWETWLRRTPLINIAPREGANYALPMGSHTGPKVLIIDEHAGSGGDGLPWFFRKMGLGPLVGKRTWGGVTVEVDHQLMDGGSICAPDSCAYGTEGEWEVENHGIAPDYDVDLEPKLWRAGRDSQLEKAVAVALQNLAKHPAKSYSHPPYPDYSSKRRTAAP